MKSAAYLTVSGQSYYLPAYGWVSIDVPLGGSYSAQVTCCYLDGCVGDKSCWTEYGNQPCTCIPATTKSGYANTCSVDVSICD